MSVQLGYLGKRLLDRGFKDWFLYMFRVIEGHDFIVEDLHHDVFKYHQDLFDKEILRGNLNVPPRAGKTTFSMYFIAFAWAYNPKCNFIYTSYSKELLDGISKQLSEIMQHPSYQQMYNLTVTVEDTEEHPVDDFWKQYLQNTENKATYSSRKIITPSGGITLFSSMGSTITGFGAGIRNNDSISTTGGVFIDDANKPADIHSPVMRNKTCKYFSETILSRLNCSDAFIDNVQQKLHIEDLSAKLEEDYGFFTLKKPLMIDGICQLPSQYSKMRLKEIQVDNYMYQAQYQQSPIVMGGSLFKREHWQYYDVLPRLEFIKTYADTAMKTKESSDYSVFQIWGKGIDGNIYCLDNIRGKWESPDLKTEAIDLWNKWKVFNQPYGQIRNRGLAVEDKASGTGLIQSLKKDHGVVLATPLMPAKDKIQRANDVIPYIKTGMVFLPENANWLKDYKDEFDVFNALTIDKVKDDQIDVTMYAIEDMLISTGAEPNIRFIHDDLEDDYDDDESDFDYD